MNKQQTKDRDGIALRLGFKMDDHSEMVYGERKGFTIIVYPGGQTINSYDRRYATVMLGVCKKASNLELDKSDFKELTKSSKNITSISVDKNKLVAVIPGAITNDKRLEKIDLAIQDIVDFLEANDYENCCQETSSRTDVIPCVVAGNFAILSTEYFEKFAEVQYQNIEKVATSNENVIMGIVGAFLGSLVGGASIYLVSKLGYVSMLTGLILGFSTIYGYKLFAGKVSKKGVFFSILIMILTTYLTNRVIWAVEIVQAFDVTLWEAFGLVPDLVDSSGLQIEYYAELAKLGIFVGIGAIVSVYSFLSNEKTKGTTYKLF